MKGCSYDMSQDALLSPRQAAELIGVAPATVRRWIREGDLRALRLGDAVNGPLKIRTGDLFEQIHLAVQTKENDGR
jgi:excisionase family DNA binding protein